MAKVQVTVRHGIGKDEALKRLQAAEKELLGRFRLTGYNGSWNGSKGTFRGSAFGQSAEGVLEVFENRVEVAVNVPFLFQRTAETAIREQLQKILRS